MSFHVIVFLFFSSLGLLLSFFFFLKKKGDRFSNSLIAFYTLFFSLEMIHACFKWGGFFTKPFFTHFTAVNAGLWLSFGPLVYLYIKRVVTHKKTEIKDYILFLPSVIMFLLHLPFYIKSTSSKIEIVSKGKIYEYAIFPSYAIWIVIAIMFFYAIYTYSRFKGKKEVGYKESIWLKWFVGSYLGFVCCFALYVFLVKFNLMSYKYDYLVDAVITVFILGLAYFGFVQPDVFYGKKDYKKVIPFVKYKKTGLSEKVSKELKLRLDELMKQEKLYLNSELRLNDIADALNVNRHHASQIINENYNLSFFDFINHYRVEEAIRLLLHNDDERLNITQIAYSSGFNSRASFYKAFKKFTNHSPTDYIEHLSAS